MPGTIQRDCLEIMDASGDKLVVNRGYVVVVPLVDVRTDHFRCHVDIGARRAQTLAIVTRRDETACGLGRRRR